jgi:hypothetical protein
MSTSYYRFKAPITNVRVETIGPHDKVTVWVNHQNAGTIVVDAGQGRDILKMFNSGEQVLHCYAGGAGHIPCVVKKDPNIQDSEYVISDYGDVLTAANVLLGRWLKTE